MSNWIKFHKLNYYNVKKNTLFLHTFENVKGFKWDLFSILVKITLHIFLMAYPRVIFQKNDYTYKLQCTTYGWKFSFRSNISEIFFENYKKKYVHTYAKSNNTLWENLCTYYTSTNIILSNDYFYRVFIFWSQLLLQSRPIHILRVNNNIILRDNTM